MDNISSRVAAAMEHSTATPTATAIPSRSSSGITSPVHRHSRSRAQSISSDRPSTIAYSLMSPPLSVSPEAAFIAASAGSQIVTNDHDSHADRWYDQHGVEPSGETALVSPAALTLVNNFLDQLLFNFLSVAKSTALTALRPAVSEVLKPKLAKDAVNLADEELREYLGSGDEDDILQTPVDPGNDWDLELVWKRTRLRCMVYSSLGDMEEEDEDYYMEQDQLDDTDRVSDVVSPAVAIFLTSILEFMGEQALIVAGQAAYHRMRVRHEKELKDGLRTPSPVSDRIVVEELDMERVALDRTLGRLWRAWKKRIRSPGFEHNGLQRAFSRSSMRSGSFHAAHLRRDSTLVDEREPMSATTTKGDDSESSQSTDKASAQLVEEPVEETAQEIVEPSEVPLPMRDCDVDEIEVPGLVSYSDDEDEEEGEVEGEDNQLPLRPKSLLILPGTIKGLPSSAISHPVTPVRRSRKRSNSLPTPGASPQNTPPKRIKVGQEVHATTTTPTHDSETGPTSEEIRPQPQAGDESPVEEAQTVAGAAEVDDDEIDPDVTPKPNKVVRRPVSMIASPASPMQEEDHIDGDIEEFTEEPEVLNFSRVSVAGRISPAGAAAAAGVSGVAAVSSVAVAAVALESTRPQPINTAIPVRTPSIHSARIVDVATPRSPRSRQGSLSVDSSRRSSQDYYQQTQQQHHAVVVLPPASIINSRSTSSVSRTNSYSSQPPIAEEPSAEAISPVSRAMATPSPLSREFATTTAPERTSSRQPRATDLPSPPVDKTLPAEDVTTPTQETQPILGSVLRHSPRSNKQQQPEEQQQVDPPSATKVTILNSTHPVTASSFLDIEDQPPEVPAKPTMSSVQHSRREARDVLPPVPERSNDRQPASPGTSIGRPSVERPMYGRDSPETPSSSRQRNYAVDTSPSSSKYKPMRTSEESTRTRATVARDFEQLMKSDQTIQYTLTPENVREVDAQSMRSLSSGSPIMPVKMRKSEDRPSMTRSRSSSEHKSVELKRTSSISRPPTLSSQSIAEDVPSSHLKGPIPRAPAGMASAARSANFQAREARVARDSTADLSTWIRSTGPDGGAPGAVSGASNGMRTASGPAGAVPQSSMDGRRLGTASSGGSNSTTRPKLLARDATINSRDETSDLIDFIRRGPPSTNPRIPKAVAPFRSTMDSDQLAAAVGGKAVDATIPDIRYSGGTAHSQTEPSIHSSVDSRSALLSSSAKPAHYSNGGGYGAAHGRDAEGGMPKKKRRGPRDPYAIDFSDEEDEDADLFDRPPPKPAKEESLADFLRNYNPPQASQTPPPPPPPSKPKKKSSAPSLMARFTRSHHYHNHGVTASAPHSTTGSANGLDAASISSKATTNGRGYIPIQVSMPYGSETYGNNSSAASNMSGMSVQSTPAAPGPLRKVPMKRFEAREAVSSMSRTNDLADFLMNSAPPGSPGAVSSAPNLSNGDDGRKRRMKF